MALGRPAPYRAAGAGAARAIFPVRGARRAEVPVLDASLFATLQPRHLRGAIQLLGLGQLALALGSLAIPHVLQWRADTARLRPLTRQVFWTYAVYIWATNLAMGLLSTLCPDALSDRSPLARAVCGYIALYWGARVLVQFVAFDRQDVPEGPLPRWAVLLAEAALVLLFVACALGYGLLALGRVGGGPGGGWGGAA